MDTILKTSALILTLSINQAAAGNTLMQRYQSAVEDAETASVEEISRRLTAINEYNASLIRHKKDRRILTVTWTNWDGYDSHVGQLVPLQREVWVTAAPQLKAFCQTFSVSTNESLQLRLEQLLGLPPSSNKSRFVQMWVAPADMFRPTPDPSISDHEAELNFPIAAGMTISEQHKQWFNDLKAKSYGEDGYPWTRLGYTYDWGNADSEIGLSEFVIQAGANIEVESVSNITQYCSKESANAALSN